MKRDLPIWSSKVELSTVSASFGIRTFMLSFVASWKCGERVCEGESFHGKTADYWQRLTLCWFLCFD